VGKASDRRIEQVKSLVQSVLSEIILEELKDPRIGIFSITEVRMARDLSFAEILVAVVGGEEAAQQTVEVLNRAAPLLWNRLRSETDLRTVPRLRFEADLRGKYSDEIFEVLENLRSKGQLEDENEDEAQTVPEDSVKEQ
jgi:ribosome-binding factor A